MNRIFFWILLQCLSSAVFGLKITIIDSYPSFNGMDNTWKSVSTGMGHTPTISPQSILEDTAFFFNTDILIVPSALNTLSTHRLNTIVRFIQSGKPVYLQSEYQATLPGNIYFKSIVTTLGGSFTWDTSFTGDLKTMKAIGTFSTTHNAVSELGYYWYSVSGEGDCNTVPFLEFGGKYHGFQYIPLNPAYGSIITTSDQDWVHRWSSVDLLENIITHLIEPQGGNAMQFDLGNDTTLCSGETLELKVNVSGADYLWQDSSTNNSFLVSQPGTYTLRVTRDYCQNIDKIVVSEKSEPKILFGNDTTLCSGISLILKSISSGGDYLWQDGSKDSFFTVENPGTYWVEVTNLCGTATDTITINSATAPAVNLGNDTSLCEGDTFILIPNIPEVTFLWQDGSVDSSYTVTQPGTYHLRVSQNNCHAIDTILIKYAPYPKVWLGNDTTLCEGESFVLDVTLANAVYKWQDNTTLPILTALQEGEYWVEVSLNNCSSTDSIQVYFEPIPVVDLGNDTSLCEGQVLSLDATFPGARYLWQDNSISSGFLVSQFGTYWVRLSNLCSSTTDTVIVTDNECWCSLYVPNAFTPGINGINDVFGPVFNCSFSKYHFIIFDRWGEKLFESGDPNETWDGMYKGVPLQEGVYLFMVTYAFSNKAGIRKEFGNVSLLRQK